MKYKHLQLLPLLSLFLSLTNNRYAQAQNVAPVICSDNLTKCYNGGTCSETADPIRCHCPVDPATGAPLFAGQFCHHMNPRVCGQGPDGEYHICIRGRCKNGFEMKADRPHGWGHRSLQIPTLDEHPGCECQYGWTGERCDENEGDNLASVTCEDGTTVCLNDSACVDLEGVTKCDCNTANAMHTGSHFVGPTCAHNVNGPMIGGGVSPPDGFISDPGFDPITNLPHFKSCHAENTDHGLEFAICLNGGTCTELIGANETQHPGCNCPSGYTGEHCEIPEALSGSVESCSPGENVDSKKGLKCYNGGQCNTYAFGSLTDKNACICPDEYIGSTCSTKISICGDNEHVCLNGGECVLKRDEYVCDCTNAVNDAMTGSGEECKYGPAVSQNPSESVQSEVDEGGKIEEGTFVGLIFGGLFVVAAAGVGFVVHNNKKKSALMKSNLATGKDLELEADGGTMLGKGGHGTSASAESSPTEAGPDIDDAEII